MGAIDTLLEQVPESQREPIRFMVEHAAKVRAAYGLETPEGTLPEMPTFEEQKAAEVRMAKALVERLMVQHAGQRDLADWESHWYGNPLLSTREMPYFAIMLNESGCLTYEALRDLAERAWTLPEWPGQYPVEQWRRLFASTDFICTLRQDGEECDLHADEYDAEGDGESLTLWRGSLHRTRRGMSWTTDRDRATWFAARGDMGGRGRPMHVYRISAPREATLAHFNRRNEHEVLVDTHGLTITKED